VWLWRATQFKHNFLRPEIYIYDRMCGCPLIPKLQDIGAQENSFKFQKQEVIE
jgi:hypothetical protein